MEDRHSPVLRACDGCLGRSWLIARLAAHLEVARGRIAVTLELSDEALIAAVAGSEAASIREQYWEFDPARARARLGVAGVDAICRCDRAYPARLLDLRAPPAVLHIAGGLDRFLRMAALDPVAIVGSRRGSPYGLDIARSLGRGLAASGVAVVSGMAFGIDSAAHAGALEAGGATIAVLACSAEQPYPRGKRELHRQIVGSGVAVSELPSGSPVWRWMFPARNRIVAALAALTVVVEAGERSGALLTAGIASALSRPVGAVPGRVTSRMATGPNRLIGSGAYLIRHPRDVLDILFGEGRRAATADGRLPLCDELSGLLSALSEGDELSVAFARAGLSTDDGLAALAELELSGYVRREPGGRFSAMP